MQRRRLPTTLAETLALALGIGAFHPQASAVVIGMARGELLHARDSRYQHIEVRDRPNLDARVLALDEGHDSYHSILPREGVLTGAYYDYYPLLTPAVRRADGLDVLILGLAAGTHARQLLHFEPQARLVGVEIDPAVVEVARAYLDFPDDPRLEVITGIDGRSYLQHSPRRFDLIIVDCFSRQSYLPFHLCSREFFAEARESLNEGGILAMNVYGYGAADPVVRRVSETLAGQFTHGSVVAALPGSHSFLLYASRGRKAPLPPDLAGPLPAALQETAAAFRSPYRSWRQTPPQSFSRPLDDDSGELDRIQDLRLRRRAADVLEQP